MSLRIVDLEINDIAIISSLSASTIDMQRLIDMGLTVGSKIRLVNKTINDGPLEIKVRDYYIALRYNIASPILVELVK